MKQKDTFRDFLARFITIIFTSFTILFLIVVLLIMIVKNNEIEVLAAELGVDPTIETSSIDNKKETVEEQIEQYIDSLPVPETEILELSIETEIIEKKDSIEQELNITSVNYIPTEEEREYAYKIALAEASTQGNMGQTLVINVAINNMRKNNLKNLIEEFESQGRYSSVKCGEVYNNGRIVNVSDVPDDIKQAVEDAFQYDYSEEMLRKEAESLGITDTKYWEGGATYFYNPNACSERQNNLRANIKVKVQYGAHIFYRYWDK